MRNLSVTRIATDAGLPITLGYAALVLVPIANELASTRPLVRALVRQNLPPEQIGLYMSPHLWTRSMPPDLWRARHVEREEAGTTDLLVVRRKNSHEVQLDGYRKVDELRTGKERDAAARLDAPTMSTPRCPSSDHIAISTAPVSEAGTMPMR